MAKLARRFNRFQFTIFGPFLFLCCNEQFRFYAISSIICYLNFLCLWLFFTTNHHDGKYRFMYRYTRLVYDIAADSDGTSASSQFLAGYVRFFFGVDLPRGLLHE